MAFQDHFSGHAQQYTQFRPRYPRSLFEYLASVSSRRDRAWDCGTGNGQAAVDLAAWFAEVVATDPSAQQIANAEPNERVSYSVAPAENSGLEAHSVDLITVAQAIHWFDLPRFYDEARRVGRENALLAAWSYGLATIDPQVDRVVWHLYSDVLGSHWPPERVMIEQGYRTIYFPFEEVATPELSMAAGWDFAALVGYLRTWSAVQKYIERHGVDPVAAIEAELLAAWGPAERTREVHWPLFMRVGRVGQIDPVRAGQAMAEGVACYQRGDLIAAEKAFRSATHLDPSNSRAQFNRAATLHGLGRWPAAADAYRRVLTLAPENADAHSNLGIVLAAQGYTAEAEAEYREAIKLNPQLATGHNNLAALLAEQGRYADAAESCRQAVTLRPEFAAAHCNLAGILKEQGRTDEAIEQARQALQLDSKLAIAQSVLALSLQARGQLDEAIAAHRAAVVLDRHDAAQHSNLLYALNYHSGFSQQQIFDEHLQWAARHAEPLRGSSEPWPNDRSPTRSLKIGYVSAHFRTHAVNDFVEPIFATHDHAECEVFCYANLAKPDATTQRLQGLADRWRDIAALSDTQAAALVRRDAIDILVDLTGHIGGNRLLMFARKPAPIQVTYLGYQNTTGMSAMDYRLTDDYADPVDVTERFYTEQLVRLPRCFFTYLPQASAPEVGPLPALANGCITFGSFNNLSKVTPEVLATWAELLQRVPGSRLILLAHVTDWLRGAICESFAKAGVAPERVELANMRPHHEYLELVSQVDIALDAFPFQGHTTTCDCLWQGVPVVMLEGQSYVSRFGGSALVTVGLRELIAKTREEYLAIAAGLTGDLPRLARIRAELRVAMQTSPILDARGFTRNLEAAYRQMWQRWCAEQG